MAKARAKGAREKQAREKQAREKLVRAQKKLDLLQGILAEVEFDGEEKVRLAQARAEKRADRVRKRVEKAAHDVAQREAKLRSVGGVRPAAVTASSPEATVAVLEQAAPAPETVGSVPGSTAEAPLVQSDEQFSEYNTHEPQSNEEHQGHDHHGHEHDHEGHWS
jgi:TolA-binding protein